MQDTPSKAMDRRETAKPIRQMKYLQTMTGYCDCVRGMGLSLRYQVTHSSVCGLYFSFIVVDQRTVYSITHGMLVSKPR